MDIASSISHLQFTSFRTSTIPLKDILCIIEVKELALVESDTNGLVTLPTQHKGDPVFEGITTLANHTLRELRLSIYVEIISRGVYPLFLTSCGIQLYLLYLRGHFKCLVKDAVCLRLVVIFALINRYILKVIEISELIEAIRLHCVRKIWKFIKVGLVTLKFIHGQLSGEVVLLVI